MGLEMPSPTKHPRTGVYRVRVAIPIKLRPTTERLFARRVELVTSLKTSDSSEAKRHGSDALAEIEAKLATARASDAGVLMNFSDRRVRALAGQWLSTMAASDVPLIFHTTATRVSMWVTPFGAGVATCRSAAVNRDAWATGV